MKRTDNISGTLQKYNRPIYRITSFVRLLLIVAIVVLVGACSDNATSPQDENVREKGELYTQWLYDGNYDLVWENSLDIFKLQYGSFNNFATESQVSMNALGQETVNVDERTFSIDATRIYERTALFENSGGLAFSFDWFLTDSDLKIFAMDVRMLFPEASSDFLNYRTKTELRLPFDGEWVVFAGGRSSQDNHHADNPDQRFAYDFGVFEDGLPFAGDGSRNNDYACFGKPILAPAAGVVVGFKSIVSDNLPGESNEADPMGNYVILNHENGEYSFLAHLKQGSVVVQLGERVTTGQLLGQCGNSGSSDLPHLHYHLQNTPVPGVGEGFPAQFQSYRANGSPVNCGGPTRWQQVQNQ